MFTTTFYSYKGGVGRTMAMMNVAAATVLTGEDVVVVDFDLEAPGLETFELCRKQKSNPFKISDKDTKEKNFPGLIDYILEYQETEKIPDIKGFIYEGNYNYLKKMLKDHDISSASEKDLGNIYYFPGNPGFKECLLFLKLFFFIGASFF